MGLYCFTLMSKPTLTDHRASVVVCRLLTAQCCSTASHTSFTVKWAIFEASPSFHFKLPHARVFHLSGMQIQERLDSWFSWGFLWRRTRKHRFETPILSRLSFDPRSRQARQIGICSRCVSEDITSVGVRNVPCLQAPSRFECGQGAPPSCKCPAGFKNCTVGGFPGNPDGGWTECCNAKTEVLHCWSQKSQMLALVQF